MSREDLAKIVGDFFITRWHQVVRCIKTE
jgi:hypothetical protein